MNTSLLLHLIAAIADVDGHADKLAVVCGMDGQPFGGDNGIAEIVEALRSPCGEHLLWLEEGDTEEDGKINRPDACYPRGIAEGFALFSMKHGKQDADDSNRGPADEHEE